MARSKQGFFSLWNTAALKRPARRKASRASKPHSRRPLGIESLESRLALAGFIAVGTDVGILAQVRVFADPENDGSHFFMSDQRNPFGNTFTGGVRVAWGDFNGDLNDELVVATGPGIQARVKIFEYNSEGAFVRQTDEFTPYGAFNGGIFVAAGDLDGDGRDELITAPDFGGLPLVQVYSDLDDDGQLGDHLVDSFLAFENTFFGGVRVGSGNTDNNTLLPDEELIAARGPGGLPEVKVFDDTDRDRQVSDNTLDDDFLAYAATFTGGVFVASGFVEGAQNTIVTGAGAGGGPHVKIFFDFNGNGQVSDNILFDEFFAYPFLFRGGVRVAVGDANTGGRRDLGTFDEEIITGAGPGGGPHVKVYSDTTDPGLLVSDNALQSQFFAYPSTNTRGIFVSYGAVTRANFTQTFPINTLIPDPGTRTFTINMPTGVSFVRDLNVGIQINHQRVSDLRMTVVHVPSGRSVRLFNQIGGIATGLDVLMDDEAAIDIGQAPTNSTNPIVGTFRVQPTFFLGNFDGIDGTGQWQLVVQDLVPVNLGAMVSWSLHFTV